MLERTVCNRRSLPAEPLWVQQSDLRTLEPLSALSRMVALISHDLRHPLTAILANAEFLTQILAGCKGTIFMRRLSVLTHPSAPDGQETSSPPWLGRAGVQLTFNKPGAFLSVAPRSVSSSMMIRRNQVTSQLSDAKCHHCCVALVVQLAASERNPYESGQVDLFAPGTP
jgi:hypothetical protein